MSIYPIVIAAMKRTDRGTGSFVTPALIEANSVDEASGIAMRMALKRFPCTTGYYNHIGKAENARIYKSQDIDSLDPMGLQ